MEAHLFEMLLSLVDTSSQVLMNFFIEVSCSPSIIMMSESDRNMLKVLR